MINKSKIKNMFSSLLFIVAFLGSVFLTHCIPVAPEPGLDSDAIVSYSVYLLNVIPEGRCEIYTTGKS